ncbi:MAG: mechanosensitive ion channel family protein [Spirochaetota bacterium]
MSFLQEIDWGGIFTAQTLAALVRVFVYAVLGLLALRVLVFVVRRTLRRRATAQVTMLVTKTISYAGVAAIVAVVLLELGVNLTPILGAAGIVGLAVGIASQASLSNMISGLFLVSEKPFAVGDVIRTGETVGTVESIDLLSVKLRTFDNLFIRVPNEKLASAQLTTITKYPIRRLDIHLVVPFDVDLAELFELLQSIARENANCLQEPTPIVVPDRYLEYGTRILFGVWFAKADFLVVKSELYAEVLRRLAAAGIRPAVPRQELSAQRGSLEVTLAGDDGASCGAPEAGTADPHGTRGRSLSEDPPGW